MRSSQEGRRRKGIVLRRLDRPCRQTPMQELRSRVRGKKAAERLARKIEGQLLAGTYESQSKATWKQFREEHETRTLAVLDVRNRQETAHALKQFERIIRPVRMQAITTRTIAEFVAKRRGERGIRKGTLVSPATINKELRHLRAVLRKAYKWGYLPKLVDFEFLKEMKKLPSYVPPEDFIRLYVACKHAVLPERHAVSRRRLVAWPAGHGLHDRLADRWVACPASRRCGP